VTLAEKEKTEPKGVLALDIGSAVRLLLKAVQRKVDKWMGGKVVTLDISSTTIRLMETRAGVIKRWADSPIEPSEIEWGAVSGEPGLGRMVKQLMASSGIRANKITTSISGLYTVSRILPMSNLPPAPTTEEAILEISRAVMPLSQDKLYFAWQTIGAEEGERQALLVGVPRDALDNELRALKAVGINPQVVELKTMALTRAVNKEQALILNIEPSSFDIIIVVNGVPEIMRTIPWQQDNLTIEDTVEHLAVTLEMTVDFYNSHHLETPLDPATPLFITGQMSTEPALMEKMQDRLDYPVEPLAPPLECPAYLPVSQYAVNIGLALRKAASAKNSGQGRLLPLDINFLPEAYRPWRPTSRQLYSVAVVVIAIALLFPLFDVASETIGKTASLQAEFDLLKVELERKQLEIKKREPLQKAIGEYQTIIDMGGNFTEDLVVIRSEAEKLGVKVGGITHEGGSIKITCQAYNYVTFREYLIALEESGRFTTPIPPPEGYPYTTGGNIVLTPAVSE